MPRKLITVLFALLIACTTTSQLLAQGAAVVEAPATSALKLASVFTDHMVLQRDREIPVWGMASPGETVSVQLDGKSREVIADEDGKWRVDFAPLAAGGPLEMTVRTEGSVLNLTDILVGEVWVASGQSNMAWTVKRSANPEEEIAAANWPKIRLLTVSRIALPQPMDEFRSFGWQVCSPETIENFSAVAYYFGRELHQKLDVPIGLINTNYGGTPMEAWTSRDALASRPTFVKDASIAEAALDTKEKLPSGHPSGLFNAMIHPVIPYAIRGAIWYQGESNAKREDKPHYHELSELMIADWRERWGQGDFPFLLVQLAGWKPDAPNWPALREAQHLTTLTMPNVAMAVATDLGDVADIHPRNKQDVGKRLSVAARALAYGENLVYRGPTYKRMVAKDGRCSISFDAIADGLQVGQGGADADGPAELKGFEVAGADRMFVPAKAKIQGDQVIVSSGDVADPIAVRYNWSGWTVGNLYNSVGLPAPPFRTDRF